MRLPTNITETKKMNLTMTASEQERKMAIMNLRNKTGLKSESGSRGDITFKYKNGLEITVNNVDFK